MEDLNALKREVVSIKRSDVVLISCDHRPERMPKPDPWVVIEDEICRSSLVFVEYFPPELEKTAYNHFLFGKRARTDGEKYINGFFNQVADLGRKHKKDIAVADIANKPLFTAYEYLLSGLPPTAFSASMVTLFLDQSIPSFLIGGGILGTTSIYLGLMLSASSQKHHVESQTRSADEWYFFGMTDARRIVTARALEQEAQRRNGEGSQLLYIAPHAHVDRVKWNLEHSDDMATMIKGKAYHSIARGLDFSIRRYQYSPFFNQWDSNSRTPIRL